MSTLAKFTPALIALSISSAVYAQDNTEVNKILERQQQQMNEF